MVTVCFSIFATVVRARIPVREESRVSGDLRNPKVLRASPSVPLFLSNHHVTIFQTSSGFRL
jgi:hypothetical protein